MRKRGLFIVLLCLVAMIPAQVEAETQNKALRFFCRISKWVDDFQLRNVDTTYISLPEHSWRFALNPAMVGINAVYDSRYLDGFGYTLHTHTVPSAQLGFRLGYRGIGMGYSWDLTNAYATNWNIALGNKSIGLEFMRQLTANIRGSVYIDGRPAPDLDFQKGQLWIKNTNINAWYALNSEHYSHNAAIKQSYIQEKTAGSILLSAFYMSSIIYTPDTTFAARETLMDGITRMITQQAGVGLGYGINYTPNKGKVLLHFAANMQLVCYSINHVSYNLPDTIYMPGEPRFSLNPVFPVHVTGNMRAAVSWEINKWVHLSAWTQFNHLRFNARDEEKTNMQISNWNWQANISIGVRFGAGRERVNRALGYENIPVTNQHYDPLEGRTKLPKWITDFFFSPSL